MMDWQPIETAPKDGTEVIGIYCREWDHFEKTIYGPWTIAFKRGKWMASWDGWNIIESETYAGTTDKEPDMEPTHWMPLPEPPTASM